MLQYLAPTLQFLLGLFVFHEAMPPERWAGFALVWLALALLSWDALRTARKGRAELAAARAAHTVAGAPAEGPSDGPSDGPDIRESLSESRP